MAGCLIEDENADIRGWTCISRKSDDNDVDIAGTGLLSVWEGLDMDEDYTLTLQAPGAGDCSASGTDLGNLWFEEDDT